MIARNRNELWGRALADELARCGVKHVFVSPGSRSAPIVMAAAADSRLRVHVQLDERSAGFLALGVGKATGTPAAVVTTSGTAVANLLPSIVESAQSEVPMLAVTADRPHRLRGADANQTIDQPGIFGRYPRYFADLSTEETSERTLTHLRSVVCRAVARAVGDPGGPAHLNLAFSKPLEPTYVADDLAPELAEGRTPGSSGRADGAPWTRSNRTTRSAGGDDVSLVADALRRARAPIVVAGILPRPWEAGPVIRRVAAALGVPLLADPLSGARYPSSPDEARPPTEVVGAYDIALRRRETASSLRPDLVLRVGLAPTSTVLNAFLAEARDAEHVLIDGGDRWKDHASVATRFVSADPARFLEALADRFDGPGSWKNAGLWRVAERAVRCGMEGERGVSPEGAVSRAVAARVTAADLVFASSSMPVRDLDTFVPDTAGALTAIGNRGASGIDGIVSTAAGASVGSGRRVVAVVGDLALLHDGNGLASLRDHEARVVVVAVNNDGGGIFHLLPIREFEPEFTRLFATPHGRELRLLAELHGLPYVAAESAAGGLDRALDEAMAWPSSGIVEVRTERAANQRQRDEVVSRLADEAAEAIESASTRE